MLTTLNKVNYISRVTPVSSENLNNIQNSVISNTEDIKNVKNDIDEHILYHSVEGHTHSNKASLDKITESKMTSWDNKLDSIPAEYITETELNAKGYLTQHQDISGKLDKNAILTMSNMGQDVKEAMTGGSVAVVGVNTILESHIVDGQVTPEKTNFFDISRENLFDKTKVTSDNLVDPYSGNLQSNLHHCASDYFQIKPNTKYVCNRKGHVAWYSADKKYISGITENDYFNSNYKSTSPANSAYVRFSIGDHKQPATSPELCMFMEGDILPNEYIPFGIVNSKIKKEYIPDMEFNLSEINGNIVKNIPVESCNFLIATTNYELADRKNVQKGQMMNYGDFSPNSGHTGFLTFVEVKPTTSYTINKKVNICWYNSSKAYIDQQNGVTGAITSPANSAYVRWSIEGTSDSDIQTTSFMETQYAGSSDDGRAKFDETKINMDKYLGGSGGDTSSTTNQWKGKKWCTYGDSITENNYYQPYVNEKLGFAQIYNKGMGGTTVSHNGSANWFGSDTRINSIPLDTDLITIMGGTNDATWVDIGEISYPFNEDTFIGGLCSTIKKIQTRLPNARIVLCSPLSGRGQTGQNGVLQEANNKGKVTGDFAKAVELVAHYFSIPFIDVFSLTGINQMNRTTYIADTVHPNSKGGQLIAKVLVKGLENIDTFKLV